MRIFIIVILLLLSSLVYAENEICKGNPEVVGSCYETRGRISVYNGTPSIRMWKVGTNRMLGIVPSENEIMPDIIKKHIDFGTEIFGDFVVCPFTEEKPGYMQMVCIESGKNIRVEDHKEDKIEITFIEE